MSDKSELLELAKQDTQLVQTARSGEHSGPCPFCGGHDRFNVWPSEGRFWCRQCGRSGDTIAYMVETGRMTRSEAYRARHKDAPPTAKQGGGLQITGSVHLRQRPSFPLTMRIPAEKAWRRGLAVPRNYKRLGDGSLEVTFEDAYELYVCLEANKAIQGG
jgi:hypothetical protein